MKYMFALLFILPLVSCKLVSISNPTIQSVGNNEVTLVLNGTFGLAFNATDSTFIDSPNCQDNFIQIGSNCYLFEETFMTWYDAINICNTLGTDLAHPSNYNENILLVTHLVKYYQQTINDTFWLGGNDEATEGQWLWAHNNSPVNITYWARGEPNNNSGNEDCIGYWLTDHWLWNDFPCSIPKSYICQQREPITK